MAITGTISPRYGNAAATPPDWADIEERLEDAQLYWFVSVRPDGRPHAVPMVGVWVDGSFNFVTGPDEQKVHNLQANAHATVTAGPLGADGWGQGKDIVAEAPSPGSPIPTGWRRSRPPTAPSTATTGPGRSTATP